MLSVAESSPAQFPECTIAPPQNAVPVHAGGGDSPCDVQASKPGSATRFARVGVTEAISKQAATAEMRKPPMGVNNRKTQRVIENVAQPPSQTMWFGKNHAQLCFWPRNHGKSMG